MERTILLVDDSSHFRELVVPVLRRRGHRVLEATTGAEALEVLRRQFVDLVIVDYLLPDTDGESWIARLRASGDSTQVVFVSSFRRDLRETQRLVTRLGVSLVLYKPVIPSAFGEQIQALFFDEATFAQERRSETALKLRALRQEVDLRLPGELAELGKTLDEAGAVPGTGALGTARTQAHRLRGILGSLGLARAGEAAGRLEDGLEDLAAGRAADAAAAWRAVKTAFADLERAALAPPEEAGEDLGGGVTPTRVLVVSGTPRGRDSLSELGRRQLLEVELAQDAGQALDRAQRRDPDVALIDLGLPPAGEGFRLARALRELPGLEALPIAFVSDIAEVDSRVAAADAGASLFLIKPLDEAVFAAAIQELLATRKTERPRVVLVDADREYAAHVSGLLAREGMDVTVLADPGALADVLSGPRPELMLVDAQLPGVSGFDVCRMVRTTPGWRDVPLLFLTTESRMRSRVAAFEAGADDYLVKPIVAEELRARVKVRVERARLLRERADKDPLTGLWLRRAFLEMARGRLAEVTRHERPLTLALVDLDQLKQINDQHGHLAGDHVLTTLGRLLQGRFRTEDLRGRWGGDEFVLAFPGERGVTIERALTRTLLEFSEMRFSGEQGEPFSSSFSAGLATAPRDGETLEDLLRRADRRLYAAKTTRGRVVAEG